MSRIPHVFISTMVAAGLATGACARQPDVDALAIGTTLQVTRDDGGVLEGTLTDRTPDAISVDIGAATRTVPRDDIADLQVLDGDRLATLPGSAKYYDMALAAGTPLTVRLTTRVDSDASYVADAVQAELVEAVVVDGTEVLPAGSVLRGAVSGLTPAEDGGHRADVMIAFEDVTPHADAVPMHAEFRVVAPALSGQNRTVGLPPEGGVVIGAIARSSTDTGLARVSQPAASPIALVKGRPITLEPGLEIVVTLTQPIDVHVPIVR